MSYKNKNGISEELEKHYENIKIVFEGDIEYRKDELRRRGLNVNRAHTFVSEYMRDSFYDALFNMYRFGAFVESYDPETGYYSLYTQKFENFLEEQEYNNFTYRLFGNDATTRFINARHQREINNDEQNINEWNNNNNNWRRDNWNRD